MLRALKAFFLLSSRLGSGVLRFPDNGYDMRWPVLLEHCEQDFPSEASAAEPAGEFLHCLIQLREHIRDDLNCSAITTDNGLYISQPDLDRILETCDHFRLAFECVFEQGLYPASDWSSLDRSFQDDWEEFVHAQINLLTQNFSGEDRFVFANTSKSIIKHHSDAVVYEAARVYSSPSWRNLLLVALVAASRLQFLIENLSMNVLINFVFGNLEFNSIVDSRDYVKEMYGDVRGRYIFHDIGPKRWDVLCSLLDRLAARKPFGLRMAEVGVESANVSARLLERYPPSVLEHYRGVDLYENRPGSGDSYYEAARSKLEAFGAGRARLHRMTSVQGAALLLDEEPFDLVFLDAGHSVEDVVEDIAVWWPRVRRPGGVLAGHDFQWQYLGVPSAVTSALQTVPVVGHVNLASDGMWWFDLS